MRQSLEAYCKQVGSLDLLREWDAAGNAPLTPADVSYGSKKKVWWRCAHGHRWQAVVTARTAGGNGCPYCAGLRPWPGETDLATCYPALAAEWDAEKNGALTPQEVLPGSHRQVWWKSAQGHSLQAMINTRAPGCGCPVCANRAVRAQDNSLAVTDPGLAAEWYQPKNGKLTPRDVVAGTRRKVWWQCAHGHIWQATIVSRAHSGAGCPVCTGKQIVPGENDLASRYPQIAAEWDTARNAPLTPEQVSPYSNRRVWWRCALGHEWKTAVYTRTHAASGCPYCSGHKVLAGFNDLATLVPEVAAQWHPTRNGTLTPQMVTPGSKKYAWWLCPEGHVWRAIIGSRAGARRCGCPVCAGRGKSVRQDRYAKMIAARRAEQGARQVSGPGET